MSMRTKAEQIEATRRAVDRGDCADAGPWGAVCTDRPGHRYSCYDGGLDISFNSRWFEDINVPSENHPFDCVCPECAPVPLVMADHA